VTSRLHAFQDRARAKPPEPATMTAVAARLDETQVRQVAAYLSTLPPP
jgi:cytochrome c553